jgi:hypothetical protein
VVVGSADPDLAGVVLDSRLHLSGFRLKPVPGSRLCQVDLFATIRPPRRRFAEAVFLSPHEYSIGRCDSRTTHSFIVEHRKSLIADESWKKHRIKRFQ